MSRRTLWSASTLVVIALAVAYASVQRRLTGWSVSTRAQANLWDQVVRVTFDPYVLVFLLVPWVLVGAARDTTHTTSDLFLLRAGSDWRWLRVAAAAGCGRVLQVGMAVGAALVASVPGFRLSTTWSSVALARDSPLSLVVVTDLGLPPAAAVGIQVAMVALSLEGLYLLVSVAALGRAASGAFLAAAALWFLVVVDFKAALPFPFSLASGMVFSLARDLVGSVALAPAVALVPLASVVLILGALHWRRRGHVTSALVKTCAAYVVVAGGAVSLAVGSAGSSSTRDTLLVALYGSTPDGTQIGRYLLLVIVFLGWAYLFGMALATELDGHFALVAIRLGSPWRWWRHFCLHWLAATALVPVVSLVLAVAWSWAPASAGSLLGSPSGLLIAYQWVVNGTLQAWVYLLVLFAARWLVPTGVGDVLALGALAVTGLPFFQAWGAPSALNGLGYALGGWMPVLAVSLRLVAWNLVLLLAAYIIIRNRRFAAGERSTL